MIYWGNQKQKEADTRIEGLVSDVTELKAELTEFEKNYSIVKEIPVTLSQTLYGTLYMYTFEYDISGWDNGEYDLQTITLKNIHKDSLNRSGEVLPQLKKGISSIVFDETKLYGSFLTPDMVSSVEGVTKVEVTCLYKKIKK